MINRFDAELFDDLTFVPLPRLRFGSGVTGGTKAPTLYTRAESAVVSSAIAARNLSAPVLRLTKDRADAPPQTGPRFVLPTLDTADPKARRASTRCWCAAAIAVGGSTAERATDSFSMPFASANAVVCRSSGCLDPTIAVYKGPSSWSTTSSASWYSSVLTAGLCVGDEADGAAARAG